MWDGQVLAAGIYAFFLYIHDTLCKLCFWDLKVNEETLPFMSTSEKFELFDWSYPNINLYLEILQAHKLTK